MIFTTEFELTTKKQYMYSTLPGNFKAVTKFMNISKRLIQPQAGIG